MFFGDASGLEPLLPWLMAAIGLILGSFANVCIHRLPRGESVVAPRSRCPRCGVQIGARDNVPVVSWLLLRGRCRACGAPIAPRYPLIEAANSLLYALAAAAFGVTPRSLLVMGFLTAFLVLALIDLEHQLLPDAITFPGVGLGIAGSLLPGSTVPLASSVVAAAAGYAVFAAIARLGRWYYGEEALGAGDWKLVAMIGALLGVLGLVTAVFLGSLAGAIVGITLLGRGRATGRTRIPFGSFLALGAVLTVFVGEPAMAWYRGLLGG